MLIVSDTTTITNLWQIQSLDLLKKMYGQVIVPTAVWQELLTVPDQAKYLPQNTWLQVKKPQNTAQVEELLNELDRGEAEAIVLSLELKADFLIIDEVMGRRKAESLQIKVIGLLGILLKAKQEGLTTQIKPLLERLDQEVGFYINPKLYQTVLQLAQE